MITYTYGVYVSNLYGETLLLDPLLPPKKCPLDCVICPLGKTRHVLGSQVIRSPRAERVYKDVEENKPIGLEPNSILIWGSGDPLVLEDTGDLLEKFRSMLQEHGVKSKLIVHSSLVRALPLEKILAAVDVLVVPYLWYGDDKHVLGWPIDLSFSTYMDILKHAARQQRGKVVLELYVFKLGTQLFPSLEHLDEAMVNIDRLGFESVIVKPVDRPSMDHLVKPTPESHVKLLLDKLAEKGFEVAIEKPQQPNSPLNWNRVIDRLYNHLLRLPLSYDEVRSIYGDLGITALSNLVERKKVVRVHWGGKIYYKAIL